uniref:Uncharacterized protein n=1 Tax=Meloidogyne incognita TaxID=6306 RepID=A0A914MT08_MELIC
MKNIGICRYFSVFIGITVGNTVRNTVLQHFEFHRYFSVSVFFGITVRNTVRNKIPISSDNDEIIKHGRLQRTEFYLGILDVKAKHSIRHLTGDKYIQIKYMCLGTFVCDDCGVTIRNVSQQFQYTQKHAEDAEEACFRACFCFSGLRPSCFLI